MNRYEEGWGKAPTGRHGPPLGTSGSASKPEGPSLCGGERMGLRRLRLALNFLGLQEAEMSPFFAYPGVLR